MVLMRVPLALVLAALLVLTAAPSAVADDMDEAGRAYVRGDYAKARKILALLAEQGSARAMTVLATIYRYGDGVEIDPEKAARLYRQASLLGDVAAQYELAQLYWIGFGVEQSVTHTLMWLTVALDLLGFEEFVADSGASKRQPITEFRQNVVAQANFLELARALDMAATCRRSKFTACD
ncbi:MAG: sel1 repeat family protein [Alphaproteobacteria bacterium]|nr:sel1 repeat family protein [Alphaproteobacteria bacterium]